MAKIKHLQQIHDLKSYRNACKVLKNLGPYVNETFYNREKVYYLSKEGRELIGSKREMKRTAAIEHILLCNEAYMYFNCPIDWKTEFIFEVAEKQPTTLEIHIKGLSLINKKKIVSDAIFNRNGYMNIVEIDNKRSMNDNLKKIKAYTELFPTLSLPKLNIFTTTLDRKRKFEKWLVDYRLRGEVWTYEEIR